MSTQRITLADAPKGITDGLFQSEHYLKDSGLDPKLSNLLCYRVSQINGCAYCLDMHFKEAIHTGETEQRLYSVSAWRECPYYSEKERAALAYAEAVTNVNLGPVTDSIFDPLTKFFSKGEIADLTLAIVQINTWNRLNIAFASMPGEYQVGQFAG
ncbi:carboxymuconolactone decarboxylase family protein [Chitinophaga agrisoli]|uniref:Carboxymuconolactone decarboxylase family protein n=1 Tax=Chitinophaga agrisoli TaxID=2607653 RepID=A0A5B2W494_9BACT|nr:carboxymuconolactone decarboxylase family protein [Chitinophaga agrisoli]KAA2245376.1 carboxymuconolactone decarboxylase family protein [Chitinophaga agrisoli]